MRILMRTMTRKSIMGFGYKSERDLSVQMMLDLGNHKRLISSYFGLEKINFTEDILDEIGILLEDRIEKPFALRGDELKQKIQEVQRKVWSNESEESVMRASNRARKKTKSRYGRAARADRCKFSNSNMQRKNHGK